jgi:hypothetical protein
MRDPVKVLLLENDFHLTPIKHITCLIDEPRAQVFLREVNLRIPGPMNEGTLRLVRLFYFVRLWRIVIWRVVVGRIALWGIIRLGVVFWFAVIWLFVAHKGVEGRNRTSRVAPGQ